MIQVWYNSFAKRMKKLINYHRLIEIPNSAYRQHGKKKLGDSIFGLIPFLFLDDGKGFRIVQNGSTKNVGEPIGSARLFNEGT